MAALISCSQNRLDHTGLYASVKPSLWRRLNPSLRFVQNESIRLDNQNKFFDTSCGTISQGTYSIVNDTLWLTYTKHEFRNDSLRAFGINGKQPKMAQKPEYFIIVGNKLSQQLLANDSSYVIVRLLKKVK